MECVNLKEMFGDKYRVIVGPEHRAERGTNVKRAVDPWQHQIKGRRGHVQFCVLWRFTKTAGAERCGRPHRKLSSEPTA